MPLYVFQCRACKGIKETVLPIGAEAPSCCGLPMGKRPTAPALIHIKGEGLPARKKWMDEWSPESPPFSTGSLHGARY